MSLTHKILLTLTASAAALVLTTWLDSRATKKRSFLPSPRHSVLPKLSQSEIDKLPYPPDALPGGRDVESPYGTIKVFEWGPTDGRKILFVHGISTPCIAFGQLAQNLVDRGCRVMLFDLFGRGYSDAPLDLPHDARLYTTQIFIALASSSISWTGSSSFDLAGYSFGGGISASFTRYFPHLVRSLILLAPGGIVRTSHINWRSTFLYSIDIFPESLLEYLVKKRLSPSADNANKTDKNPTETAESVITAEVEEGEINLVKSGRSVNPEAAADWQLNNHDAFIPAFMSSIRYGPIHNQHADWEVLAQRLNAKRTSSASNEEFAMQFRSPRALLVLGENDELVLKDEVGSDVTAVLDERNVQVTIIPGGHEFPISRADDLADAIWEFWSPKKYLELLQD